MALPLKDNGLRSGLPTSHTASLLLILNNCSYTKDVILPQIYKALVKLGYPDMSEAIDKARTAINVSSFYWPSIMEPSLVPY